MNIKKTNHKYLYSYLNSPVEDLITDPEVVTILETMIGSGSSDIAEQALAAALAAADAVDSLTIIVEDEKQDNLVSGTNIKTVNNNSLVGSGNVNIVNSLSEVLDEGSTADTAQIVLTGTSDIHFQDGAYLPFINIGVSAADGYGGIDFMDADDKVFAYMNGAALGTPRIDLLMDDGNLSNATSITSGPHSGIWAVVINKPGTVAMLSDIPYAQVTQAQRLAIASPILGLHVYQTDGTEGVYVKKSGGWAFAY